MTKPGSQWPAAKSLRQEPAQLVHWLEAASQVPWWQLQKNVNDSQRQSLTKRLTGVAGPFLKKWAQNWQWQRWWRSRDMSHVKCQLHMCMKTQFVIDNHMNTKKHLTRVGETVSVNGARSLTFWSTSRFRHKLIQPQWELQAPKIRQWLTVTNQIDYMGFRLQNKIIGPCHAQPKQFNGFATRTWNLNHWK